MKNIAFLQNALVIEWLKSSISANIPTSQSAFRQISQEDSNQKDCPRKACAPEIFSQELSLW